jgi:hypothetical protein
MATIGRISVPEPSASATFPLRTDFGHGQARKRQEIVHLFGDATGKVEQRFYMGPAARRFIFKRAGLKRSERAALAAFWEAMKGSEGAFFYDVPQDDQTFVTITAYFENQPLTLDDLADHICSVGLTIVEIPTAATAASYSIVGTDTRFPSSILATALGDQVQEIIPLVHIRVTEAAVPDIYLSDRMVTVGGITYLPRLLEIGDPGSDTLISQSIDGASDDVRFTFGNADRVMVQLANDTDLHEAKIELSLFHVGSGIKLDLWAGQIVDWSSDKGPLFTVQASDIIAALTLQSPVGSISRTCWRIVGDINFGCPATPGSTCDLTMEGPDGCKAKGGTVKLSFGGVNIAPQLVTIKDNSTGTFGFGRELVTPTSQISDTIYGQTLPEIWHNDDGLPQGGLPVQCRMVDGREESDFYEGLGIVGRGPIGGYTTPQMYDSDGDGIAETFLGSTLDGQPHHGFQQTSTSGAYTDSGLGLRKANGDDPVVPNDYFSLDRTAGTPGPGEITALGGSSIVLDNYAAGVAFLVIRRTDQKGIQPSEVNSHQMTAMISQGLKGWSWGAPGSRAEVAGLTNPFWVAINTFLRSLGREKADAVIQEDYFDVVAAAACGAVADTTVPSLVGGGTELQFRFKGKIDARKSLRDRLTEILNNCLGYYTFEFGKLKLGIRSSATPETNFAAGNMLFSSLKLTPLKPDFEKLTVEFADTEFLFAQNTVDYTDLDYALRHNRVQNPKNSQLGLIGCSTKSQGGRIAVIRTREELGGVGVAEQKNARTATWRTTILGLDTQAGQVVGLTDPDVPGGAGAFRIQSWRLNRDWSLDITAKTVTASMYDLSVGSVAVDVTATRQPSQSGLDQGPPPAPLFSGRVAPDDAMAAEVYDLHFASTINTQTITQGLFTFYYHDPSITGDPTKTKIVSTSFPMGFFAITPPATTYQQAALDWVLKAQLPGMNVTRIDGYVSNAYGDSPVTSITVNLQLAKLPPSPVGGSGGTPRGTFSDGTWYGQVPRGAQDGTNKVFTLDYNLGSPFTLLSINGIVQRPPRDGAGAFPGPDYAITGNILTYNVAPAATDWQYIWYISGSQPSTTTIPGITTPIATVYLISEHLPNPTSGNAGGGAGFNDTVGLFSPPTWMHDGSAWSKRTDWHTLTDTEYASLLDGSIYLLLDQYHIGSAIGALDPPDQWRIYDAYIVVTQPNGSTQTWRPTAYAVGPDPSEPNVSVTDPGFAIDGSDTTYAVLEATSYGLAFDGAFLNLNTWVSSDPTVNQINGGGNNTGGGTGTTGNTTTADLIAADMTGSSEGSPHGWPYSTDPVVNSLPSGESFLEWWSDLYVDAAGNPATNTRVTVRNVQMWWLNTSTNTWVNGFGPTSTFDGGYYNENFSGVQLGGISFADSPDGRAYSTTAGKVAHAFTPFPRVGIDPANFGGVVVVAEAKLVLINPTGTDDRSTAKFLFQVGSDPYPSGTGPGIENNTALVASKFKYVTSNWQSFSATTLSQSALESNPPPIDLTGI